MVDEIFDKIDIDGNGNLEYSEWVIATIDKQKLMTPEKLEAAFQLFLKDSTTRLISHEDVKAVLSQDQDIDDEIWMKVIEEVDQDGSGDIDFEEFTDMFNMFFKPQH